MNGPSLRLLHTSDWHLGKKIYGQERLDEQRLFLSWLTETIVAKNVDILVMAGDVFDVPAPGAAAQQAYFDFLFEVSQQSRCEVVLIGGNHDSGRFIEAPQKLLKQHRIHAVGNLDQQARGHFPTFAFPGQEKKRLCLTLLPYFRQHELVRFCEKRPSSGGGIRPAEMLSSEMIDILFERLVAERPRADAHWLVAHHLFGGFMAAGSEQNIQTSGLDSIRLSSLQHRYQGALLGHIHNPQILKRQNPLALYSGSPISFRFSEKSAKSVALLDVSPAGELNHQWLPIPSWRGLYQIALQSGDDWLARLEEKLAGLAPSPLTPLVELTLTLQAPAPGLIDEIKDFFAAGAATLASLQVVFCDQDGLRVEEDVKLNSSVEELFEQYWQQRFPGAPSDSVRQEFFRLWGEAEQRAKGTP